MAYAAVNHAQEYKDQMDGRHGQQLKLAIREGNEKSDGTHFNPFEAYAIPDPSENVTLDEENGSFEGESDGEGYLIGKDAVDRNADTESSSEEEEDWEQEVESSTISEHSLLSQVQALYHPDGSPRSLTAARKNSLRAGLPAGGSFAIIQLGGTQEKVTVDDLIIINKIRPVEKYSVGSTHILKNEHVLLMGDQDKTLVGLPFVKGGEVEVMVEEITRDKTIDIFKKRRRKNSRRKNGFRREVTFVRILDIRFPEKHREEVLSAASEE